MNGWEVVYTIDYIDAAGRYRTEFLTMTYAVLEADEAERRWREMYADEQGVTFLEVRPAGWVL